MELKIIIEDITTLSVDAIVNAANTALLGGGGVDGAIHRAAGVQLLQECKTLNGCETGNAKITKGYNLKAKYVIHTVGPIWHGGGRNEEKLLESCYKKSLELADEYGMESIAFPNISTGVYNFPKSIAAEIALATVKQYFSEHKSFLKTVVFACFDAENYEFYNKRL